MDDLLREAEAAVAGADPTGMAWDTVIRLVADGVYQSVYHRLTGLAVGTQYPPEIRRWADTRAQGLAQEQAVIVEARLRQELGRAPHG